MIPAEGHQTHKHNKDCNHWGAGNIQILLDSEIDHQKLGVLEYGDDKYKNIFIKLFSYEIGTQLWLICSTL